MNRPDSLVVEVIVSSIARQKGPDKEPFREPRELSRGTYPCKSSTMAESSFMTQLEKDKPRIATRLFHYLPFYIRAVTDRCYCSLLVCSIYFNAGLLEPVHDHFFGMTIFIVHSRTNHGVGWLHGVNKFL